MTLGGCHFLPNRGAMKKLGVTKFFPEKLGGHKKNQEIIGWLQISMKILLHEVAFKMHIFRATRIVVTCFFNTVAPERGHKMFDHHKNIAEVLSEIHDPPIPKKMVAPYMSQYVVAMVTMKTQISFFTVIFSQ